MEGGRGRGRGKGVGEGILECDVHVCDESYYK